jgi:hypothetical protein
LQRLLRHMPEKVVDLLVTTPGVFSKLLTNSEFHLIERNIVFGISSASMCSITLTRLLNINVQFSCVLKDCSPRFPANFVCWVPTIYLCLVYVGINFLSSYISVTIVVKMKLSVLTVQFYIQVRCVYIITALRRQLNDKHSL